LPKPLFVFCADLQAREHAYRSNKDLRGDDLYALRQVVDYCNQEGLPLILGGDQVDTPTISDAHTILLRKELARMAYRNSVYYIDGNHEKGFRRLSLEGGDASVAKNLETEPFIYIGGIKIKGYNWRSRKHWEEYLEQKSIPSGDVVILHGFCEQVVEALKLPADRKPMCDMDLGWFDGKFKLALMGDIHMEWDWTGPEGTRFMYPGSMWMHRLGEPENKSFIVVYDDLSVSRQPLNCRPFLKVHLECEEDLKFIREWLDEAANVEYISAMKEYMGDILPRLHVSFPSALESKIAIALKELESECHMFRKVDVSQDTDLTEAQGSTTEQIDIDTALQKMLDGKVEVQKNAIDFIKQCLEQGLDKATDDLKAKVGM